MGYRKKRIFRASHSTRSITLCQR